MTTHGGRRLGAGRKPKPKGEKFVKVLISLPPDLAKKLKRLPIGSRSAVVAYAIEEAFKKN